MLIEIPPQKLLFLLFIYVRIYDLQEKKIPTDRMHFFGGKILQNLKKTCKKKISGLKCLYRNSCTDVRPYLVIVKLQGPIVVAFSRAAASKTLGFLCQNLTLAPKETKVAAYKALVRPQLKYAAPIWKVKR